MGATAVLVTVGAAAVLVTVGAAAAVLVTVGADLGAAAVQGKNDSVSRGTHISLHRQAIPESIQTLVLIVLIVRVASLPDDRGLDLFF